jgi:hypothetical protein
MRLPSKVPLVEPAGPGPISGAFMTVTIHRRVFALFLLVSAFLLIGSSASAAPAKRRLAAKECVACHQPVLQEQSKKTVHAPFADANCCENCHKPHGIV